MTNYVGQVDMVVDLGDGSFHPDPYNVAASPYNYSDMTGFNNRVVNRSLQPLKGYWIVIHDSGRENEFWERVSWSNSLPPGCSMEVWVRAGDDRLGLAHEPFVAVSNNVPFTGVNGRYIEVRLALIRDDPAKQPVLYDLTLHGLSTVWAEGGYVDYWWPVFEGDDVEFWPVFNAPEPCSYQWYALYPWAEEYIALGGQTNATLISTNVDSFDHGTWFGVWVTSATGEGRFLDPARLEVIPVTIVIPTNGPALRYPAEIQVFGQTTNFTRVEVILKYLSHQRPADLDILLVSPSGHKIMLMSDAGDTNAVSNATLAFHPWPYVASGYPPLSGPIPSNTRSDYWPANYGEVEAQLPGAPPGPYLDGLEYVTGTDPNGIWRLYIFDDQSGIGGWLHGSWELKFHYE